MREQLRYEAGARYDPAVEFAQPSPYVPRLHALRDYAVASFGAGTAGGAGRAGADASHPRRLRVHDQRSTDVDTPLIEAFEQRSGVCQDFAHLMIAALRMLGPGGALCQRLPADARRRRGRRRCSAPTPRMPGCRCTAPTHRACPGGWLELDPTNDLVPDTGHVRLALGRDYGDVTPLRGVIRGGGRHTLNVRVNTRRLQGPQARMLLT